MNNNFKGMIQISAANVFDTREDMKKYFIRLPCELEKNIYVLISNSKKSEVLQYLGEGEIWNDDDWKIVQEFSSILWKDVFNFTPERLKNIASSMGYSYFAFNGEVYNIKDPDINAICGVEEVR